MKKDALWNGLRNFFLGIVQDIKTHPFAFALFLLTTAFFIWQHATTFAWDFSVFSLNGQFWFQDGFYFEPFRPPFTSLLLGIFGLGGIVFGEYLFIVLVSFAFFIATLRLAKELDFNPTFFFVLFLTPFFIDVAMFNGSEILSLVCIELALISLLREQVISGFFLALAGLTRYAVLPLGAFVLLLGRWKRIVLAGMIAAITFLPWFIYNHVVYGHFLTSIADQYAQNILFRQEIIQPIQLVHLVEVSFILLPFIIAGFILSLGSLYRIIKKHYTKRSFQRILRLIRADLFMLFFTIYMVYSYASTPFKLERYLFLLVLPFAYYSYLAFAYVKKKFSWSWLYPVVASILIISSVIALFILIPQQGNETSALYQQTIADIQETPYSTCQLASNAWLFLNYLGAPTQPLPHDELLQDALDEGVVFIIYPHIADPLYASNESFVQTLPIVSQTSQYYIIARNSSCEPAHPLNRTYLSEMKKVFEARGATHFPTHPCDVLFSDSLARACHFFDAS